MDSRSVLRQRQAIEAAARYKLYKARKELNAELQKRRAIKKMILEQREAEGTLPFEDDRLPMFNIMETIPEVSEALPVDIEVHGIRARFYPDRPDEDIVPRRYLEKAEYDYIVHRPVWIFSKAKDGHKVDIETWPTLNTNFYDVFRNLNESPQWKKGLFEDDEGAAATCPRGSTFEEARLYQDNAIHALLSELFFRVDVMRATTTLVVSFHFSRPKIMRGCPKYVTRYGKKHNDGPLSSGRIVVEYFPKPYSRHTVIPVTTSLSEHQPLRETLCANFKMHLTQLANLRHVPSRADHLPDQEVFVINLHGSRLHIQRAIFPGSKTSRAWCGKYHPVGGNRELHVFKASDTSRRYTERDMEWDIDQLDWLHTLRDDERETPDENGNPVFRVLASQEYDLWTKSGWHAALRLLAGLNHYLMGGRAKCAVMQVMFREFPVEK
ncbi:hypothetical protein ASPBRDRAFT_190172 [Aspergillus brasiliensis CBS 101740]|uniref:Uncharacterized protein n=1 Tax=Aspergillus brasiliensis (strain CBS 101740 / IMI 381727 / IBT 21946) TaxID=767769 RepID=A0A1L9UYN4_ASPBC|nr:hypothetical protein ASPBRDRAFT_190172 [Aspergillus brasiliensis CBS 101740]